MEKKNSGGYFVRVFFSVVFVMIMLISMAYGVYRGADYLIKYRSEQYQKYYGYLQSDEEAEKVMIKAAGSIVNAAADMALWGESSYEDGESALTGIHQAVVIGDYYYEKKAGTNSVHKYVRDWGPDYDTFLDDKMVALKYDGEAAYIKYADGRVEKYGKEDALNDIDKNISDFVPYLDLSEILIYVWVDEVYYADANPGLEYMNTLRDYNLEYIIIAFCVAGLSFIVASLLSVRTGKGRMREKQLFTEIPMICIGFLIIGSICTIDDMIFDRFYDYNKSVKIIVTILLCVQVFAAYLCIRECVIKVKEKRFLKDSCLVKIVRWMGRKCKEVFQLILDRSNYKDFSITKKLWIRRIIFIIFSIVYIIAGCLCINGFGISYAYDGWGYYECVDLGYVILLAGIYMGLFLIYNFYEMKFLKSLNDVYRQVDDIYHGEYAIRDVEENDLTYDITEKLNGLSNGLEEAIEKRISSEKMKVELITNVSHDLKTPLTSIISYVNLLKQEEMTDVGAAYVKILEDKSYQLRNIVSDVFDLAKANSGQDVDIETIDGIMLINQVLADMNDVIEQSGKIIRADITPDTFFIKGDGRKLYRALQNLIDNALKYSMDGTRIYIRSRVENDRLKLVIKNIAAYEMDFSGKDIVERFVRGDESRTTEGNGLGLSIAKSFIEVSGGAMNVDIDGDVFQVTVEF